MHIPAELSECLRTQIISAPLSHSTEKRSTPGLVIRRGSLTLELTLALMTAVTIPQHCVLLDLQDTEFCLEELSNALLDLKAQG